MSTRLKAFENSLAFSIPINPFLEVFCRLDMYESNEEGKKQVTRQF